MDYWKSEPELLESLVASVPEIMNSQKDNGQFGTEPWICHDQQVILALAAAWTLEESDFRQNDQVLESIIRGGDALIEAADENGMWTFRKKDNSTWGQILMPWTYSRWIRAYALTRDAFTDEARERWDEALQLGFDGISKTCLERIHNIPTHHAMGLYCAGMVFERGEWLEQASSFMPRVIEQQSKDGYWSEHYGPVVAYSFVYSEALGVYYSLSGDGQVLDSLGRTAAFHANYTYPDGSAVETVDERNGYQSGVQLGNPGFCFSKAGRGYLARQHGLFLETNERFDSDYAANLLLYGAEGEAEETAAGQNSFTHMLSDKALIKRSGLWFISISGFVCDQPQHRWLQDRQNFLSVFHDQTGLIIGGGNTKMQPLWSTFTAGDILELKHTPGDESPDFKPQGNLIHIPDQSSLLRNGEAVGLSLRYGEANCRFTVHAKSDTKMKLVYEVDEGSDERLEAHVTFLPLLDQPLKLSTGETIDLEKDECDCECAGFDHGGWRVSLPVGSRLVWAALPHNPYRKGGEAEIGEGLIVAALTFDDGEGRKEIQLEVL